MSLRLKLTFLYSGFLALTLLFFGALVYIILHHNLTAETDRAIAEIARDVVRSTRIVENHSLPLRHVVLPNMDVFSSSNTYIQVLERNGSVAVQSRNLGGQIMPLSEDTLRQAARGKDFYETVMAGDQSIRIYNLPLVYNNQLVGVLQVGRTMGMMEATLGRLRVLLFIGSGITLFLTSTLGWIMAGQALRPIGRMTEAASAIQEAQDLTRRIHYSGPRDEVGRLAETLNLMLERLHRAYQVLEEAGAAQRRFLSDASHELRTPLTIIRGNVELLRKMGDRDPQTRAEALDDIAGEAERMSRLVADLLALARADSGFKLEMGPVDMGSLFADVVRQSSLMAGEVDFVAEGAGMLEGVTVQGNADSLKQLFLILLDNAFNYTGAGGTVYLEGRLQGDRVEVVVRDTGVGIAESDLPRIFDRFHRSDRTRQRDGTGLGLAIARWIVEQHGGTIEVQSREGEGSTFTVSLPKSR
ncbi:MAG TPA: HAMP domain-containing sensor histidine kinase [Bacillota bacterium]|jgi:signal transduction histidine kinase|nr:HAMP domain-containing sensor histidine kinase [Peptococcaceae bacterium MAG4]NLW38341.1 HAMP domain-containing histidine kinase [Peptococcaceae bacterium]HPU35660.1 HAMP domain-containing sensor histidine kinase [Bacillota bacterium]HPZ42988.1 HAMP domain-containing sensor histidine kinase [Bacillota bacterium]HQD75376.1 HAMP domain-containing sensor histidine kinase [Bacillota bacterium]